jgi:hypothetical protein
MCNFLPNLLNPFHLSYALNRKSYERIDIFTRKLSL